MSPIPTIEAILEELKVAGPPESKPGPELLDDKTRSLVGIGAAVAMAASTLTYRRLVDQALAAGASPDECIGALFAVASVAGAARMVTAAPRLAAALGYDIDQAIEFD